MNQHTDPFQQTITKALDSSGNGERAQTRPSSPSGPIEPRYALLINPFYPKDAHASFGKHVLTPTLALSSFAATTPDHWRVDYWDENLLHGTAAV